MTEERKERIDRRKTRGIMGFFTRQKEAQEKKRKEAELKEQQKINASKIEVDIFNRQVYIIAGVVAVLGAVGIYFLTKKK